MVTKEGLKKIIYENYNYNYCTAINKQNIWSK